MPYLGEISALATALFWSFSSLVFTEAGNRIGTIQLNISRMLVASIILFLTMLAFHLKIDISIMQFVYLSLSGLIGLVIGDTFLFSAYRKIGPRITILIMSINPAISGILAFFLLSETLSFFSIIGIFVTLLGIYIVIYKKDSKNDALTRKQKIGYLFAFLAACGQGIGIIFAKMAFNLGEINTFVATFVRITSAVIIMFPGLWIRKYECPVTVLNRDRKALKLVIWGAILGPVLGITLSYIAVTHTQVGIATTLMATMPILVLPLTRFMYKEKISTQSIIGSIIAVLGIFILFIK